MVRDLTRSRAVDIPSDDDLAARAAGGDMAAFDELYRRHATSAWRVAQAVAANADDAADAVADAFVQVFQALPAGRLTQGVPFRPYLLKATRNAAIDTLRRGQRVAPTSELRMLDATSTGVTPPEHVVVAEEVALAAEAFRALPERWRSVLWLTEVEGMPAREASAVLGLSSNAVAQLALRARAGLRRNYLQAHVRNGVSRGCRVTVDRMGAYVAGTLARRDIAKVDRHLDGCADCRARLADLEDLGSTLRRGVAPLPIGIGVLAAARSHLFHNAGRAVSLTLRKVVSVAAASVLALGVAGVVLAPRGVDGGKQPRTTRAPASAGATSPQAVELSTAQRSDAGTTEATGPSPSTIGSGAGSQRTSQPVAVIPPATDNMPVPPPVGNKPIAPPTPAPAPSGLELTASGALGVTGLGVAAGGCNALTLEPSAHGCVGNPRTGPGLTVALSTPLAPRPVAVALP